MAGPCGSHHPPWILPKVLKVIIPKSENLGESARHVGRGRDAVCSKGASSAILPGRRASATAARDVGRRHGNGRAEKLKKDLGKRRRGN